MKLPSTAETGADPRVGIQARLEAASAYNAWIADQARPHLGRRLLDAGCGAGNITGLLLDRELVVAVDEWGEFVEITRRRLGHLPHVKVHQADLADQKAMESLQAYRLDSAICLNVLEHIEDDRQALLNVARLLPPGGPLFLLVPAFPVLYGEMDRADHHFRRYTKRSLRHLVAALPFETERSYYMNMPGFLSWLIVGRVLRRSVVSEQAYGLYDRIVPALSRLEARVRPPFGQSLVALLRKSA